MVTILQTLNHQLRQPPEVIIRLAAGNEDGDGLSRQPARHKLQRLSRLPIQPLRIVDHRKKRSTKAASETRLSTTEPDKKTIRREHHAQPEDGLEGVTLEGWKAPETIEYRGTPSWCSPANGSSISDSTVFYRATRSSRKQNRIAYSGGASCRCPTSAPHHQRTALSGTPAYEHTIDNRFQLGAAAPRSALSPRTKRLLMHLRQTTASERRRPKSRQLTPARSSSASSS